MPTTRFHHVLLPLALVALPGTAPACSSCGCNLSADWVGQGLVSSPGFSADLREDFVDQGDLRTGSRRATPADIAAARAAGQEIEGRTVNRYTTASLNYNPDSRWGFSLQLPWVLRTHATEQFDGIAYAPLFSRGNSLGDIRLVARYQGFAGLPGTGVLAGLKLPTGNTRDTFSDGSALDRSLQPGTGSTDGLIGLYGAGALDRDFDWFAQAVFQSALVTRDGYRPGNSLNLNAGLRYMSLGALAPQLQLNYLDKTRDGGVSGDPAATGGRLLHVTPGVGYTLSPRLSLFANVQLPLYQHVNGLQLATTANYSLGLHYRWR